MMLKKGMIASVLIWALPGTFPVFAVATDSNASKGDILNIKAPVIEEDRKSMFDFILDPQELLYETGAERFDGGNVEEGATLLFHNRGKQYDFSKASDRLTITNKSRNPVTVTVSVSVTELCELSICEDEAFSEGEHSFYLAVADDQGNEEPIHADGKASVCFDMDAMEDDGYFEEYSFWLTGSCNPDADWKGVSDRPAIKITWCVEPRNFEESEEIVEESEEPELKSEITAGLNPAEEKIGTKRKIISEIEELDTEKLRLKELEAKPKMKTTEKSSEVEKSDLEELESKLKTEPESDSATEESEMENESTKEEISETEGATTESK